MTEAFLHYVWQYQYFDKSDLTTSTGEPVSVFFPGIRNADAGPDFFQAKVRIGAMNWIGNVEIHIHASGWSEHKHHLDEAYDNVILHVVWKEDRQIRRRDQSELPTIELKNRVDNALVMQYRKLLNQPGKIPCGTFLNRVPGITRVSMLERTLVQRLEAKATLVLGMLKRNNQDWEESAFQLICRNFGFKVNAEPFEQLALGLPFRKLMKHADNLLQVEALLFGQAGFLEDEAVDGYYRLLKREYRLLSQKFALGSRRLHKMQWRFLRLRPANFPTLRIAQLASLLFSRRNIFSRILGAKSRKELVEIFTVAQSEYWQKHYRFFKPVHETVAGLGPASIDNIIINSVIPLLAGYGKYRDDPAFIDKAVNILGQTSPEENAIVNAWTSLGFASRSAADSQSLIELYNSYCQRRRCLDCKIGFSLVGPKTP